MVVDFADSKNMSIETRLRQAPKSRSTDFDGIDYSYARRRNSGSRKGDSMPVSYIVIGVVGALAIIAAVKLTPDFIRYMKMRSM